MLDSIFVVADKKSNTRNPAPKTHPYYVQKNRAVQSPDSNTEGVRVWIVVALKSRRRLLYFPAAPGNDKQLIMTNGFPEDPKSYRFRETL